MHTVTVDPEEALLATLGVDCIIRNEFPRVGLGKVREAAELMRTIDDKVRTMIHGTGKFSTPKRQHNYRDLLPRMTEPFPGDEVQKIIASFPPEEVELAGHFAILAQHVFATLQGLFPVSKTVNFAGPKNIQPTDDRIWHFFNQLSVLNDPLRVIDLMGSAALLKSQVEAMRDVYPTLSQYVDNALIEATIEARAENEDFQLGPRAEVGVATWRGRKVLAYKDPNAQPPPKPQPKVQGKKQDDLLTVGQAGGVKT